MDSFEIELRSSKILFILFIIIYLGALVIVWVTPIIFSSIGETFNVIISLILKLSLSILIIYYFKKTVYLHVFRRSKHAIIKLWQDSKGCFGCLYNSGLAVKGQLKEDTFYNNFLIILRLKIHTRIIIILIPKDAININEFRLLSAKIRH